MTGTERIRATVAALFVVGAFVGWACADRWHATGGLQLPHDGSLDDRYTIHEDAVPYVELGISGPLVAQRPARAPLYIPQQSAPTPPLATPVEPSEVGHHIPQDPVSSTAEYVAVGTSGLALIGALVFAIIKWRAK